MAEPTQFFLKHQELTELLVKHQDIHEGHWQLVVTFGFGAGNAQTNPSEFMPTAMVAVQGIGLQKAPEPNPLTVDAAKINPAPEA
jgi:hypothetical protein